MSFDSEPGPDGGLPPVDVVVPDDARELAREVLAYRREVRARRRRERVLRLLGRSGLPRHATFFPLVATCVALALLAGTMLSVMTISTVPPSSTSSQPAVTSMPQGVVELDDAQVVYTDTLDESLLALIPNDCACGSTLETLAAQAKAADVKVYFVYDAPNTNASLAQVTAQADQYGDNVAQAALDFTDVLFLAFAATRLTALLVDRDGGVQVVRDFPAKLDLTPALRDLRATH